VSFVRFFSDDGYLLKRRAAGCPGSATTGLFLRRDRAVSGKSEGNNDIAARLLCIAMVLLLFIN